MRIPGAPVWRDASDEVKRLKSLEEENMQLKRLVGTMALDIEGLKNALTKKY